MGLFDKIMDFIGGSGSDRSGRDRTPDSTVTVEYDPATSVETEPEADPEPDAETEATVKGVEDDTSEADSAAAADDETAPEPETTDSPAVDTIDGIGPTYAGRLEDAGIGTVADLAAADPAEVADAAQTSESRAEDWTARASER